MFTRDNWVGVDPACIVTIKIISAYLPGINTSNLGVEIIQFRISLSKRNLSFRMNTQFFNITIYVPKYCLMLMENSITSQTSFGKATSLCRTANVVLQNAVKRRYKETEISNITAD